MRRLAAVLTAVVVAVSGCATIETSGPVEEVPFSAQPPGIDVAPEPPQAGVTPTRLVEGFLQAMADPEGDYAVARQYLTADANEGWNPRGAVVYEGTVTGDADGAVLDGTAVGILDSSGHHTAVAEKLGHDFGLTRQGDQWRIGVPPEGLMLSRYLFERYYSRVPLYYMSTAGSHVVPDLVHIPETQLTPTRIVEALLDGPSRSIARAVSNAMPSGVTLGEEGAVIDARGVVTVDLEGLSPLLGDAARRRMGAQLIWSLSSLPRVTGLAVTNDSMGFTLPEANVRGILELSTQQGYQVLSRAVPSSELFGIQVGVPGIITDDFDPLAHGDATYADLASSFDGGTIALVDETRSQLFTGPRNGPLTPVETGLTNLRRPQFVLGAAWVLGDDATGRPVLIRALRDGTTEQVVLDEPDQRIETFAVSPTGSRIALILSGPTGRRLGVATVMSTSPARIVAWQELVLMSGGDRPVSEVTSVAWSDETLLALVAATDGDITVLTTQVDGSGVQDLSPPSDEPESVTALARQGGGPIAVLTHSGAVWRFDPRTRWGRIGEDMDAIGYSG